MIRLILAEQAVADYARANGLRLDSDSRLPALLKDRLVTLTLITMRRAG